MGCIEVDKLDEMARIIRNVGMDVEKPANVYKGPVGPVQLSKSFEDECGWVETTLRLNGYSYILDSGRFMKLFCKNEKIKEVDWPSQRLKWVEVAGKRIGEFYNY